MIFEKLPSPNELISIYPLNQVQKEFIFRSRNTIKNILDGIDPRLLLIIGPCSIHDRDSTLEYAEKFSRLAAEVSDHCYLVMRTYLEKPRTTIGWKGFIADPDLDQSNHIAKGLHLSRQLLLDLTEMAIPLGCELLELNTHQYISDLLTWGCIGARTTTSQPHRQLAASLSFPIAFKNTCDGNVDKAINAIHTANAEHVYLGLDPEGKINKISALGNSYCHLILRGKENGPNYDPLSVNETINKIKNADLLCQRFLIDCSHDNCGKVHHRQISVFKSVFDQILKGTTSIAGLMLESHLHAGSQSIPENSNHLKYGVSITDPCLDWKSTETLIKETHAALSSHLVST